jgi:hypothetical protein
VRRAALLFLLLLSAPGCGGGTATLLVVTVTAKEGVAQPALLHVVFSNEGDRNEQVLTKNNRDQPPTLPTSFAIRADGRKGPAEISIRAKDDHDVVIGEGSGTAEIVADKRVDLVVTLYPTDFQVNARYQEDQIFSTDIGGAAFGRQVAAAADGSFVVVWEDFSSVMQRFDAYYRLFDKNGVPRLNAVTGKSEENTANESNDVYDMPAVAVQDDGRFVISFQRFNKTANTSQIFSRAFTSDGKPDAASDSGHEIQLSGPEVTGSLHGEAPFVAALKDDDRGYIVVWHQENGTNLEVKGRFLGPNGVPTKTANGKNEPFSIATITAGAQLVYPSPAVAAGVNKGFMVVWNDNGALKGRSYAAKAAPISVTFDVDTTKSGKVLEANISWLSYGYAVGWTDQLAVPPDSEGSCIRFRRFDLNGAAKDDQEFTLNTSVAGNQRHPSLSTRSDGSILVAWSTDNAASDPLGGIRARRVLSNGIPVGNDFQVNTTTIDRQEKPSVAARGQESFIVGFVDNSRTPPDTLGSGIRARLLYPEYRPSDGQIGALCDVANQGSCAADLYCAQSYSGPRCLNRCDKATPSCPNGGTCTTLSGAEINLCLYK